MAAAADLVTLYRIRRGPQETAETRAGIDGPKFLLISEYMDESNILKDKL